MKKIANKMVQIIVKEELVDVSQITKLSYGIEAGLEIVVSLGCIFLVMVFTNQILFVSAFLIAFSLLRFFTGGLHLNKFRYCLMLSNGVLLVVTYNAKLFEHMLSIVNIIPILLIIYFFSPQSSPKRQLSNKERKIFSVRRNIVLIMFVAIICFSEHSIIVYAIQWALIINAISLILGELKNLFYMQNDFDKNN